MNKKIDNADYYRYEFKKLRAGIYYAQADYKKAQPALLDWLADAQRVKRTPAEIAYICQKLGTMFDSLGEFERGRSYIKLGKDTLNEAKASAVSPEYLALIEVEGLLLAREGGETNTQAAIDLLEPAIAAAESANDDNLILPLIGLYNSLAIAQSYQGRRNLSIPTFEKAVELAHKTADLSGLAYSLLNQADDYVIMGNWELAEKSVVEALALARRFGDKDTEVFALSVHGDILNGKEQWAEAAGILQLAIELGIENEIVWNIGYMCADLGKSLLGLNRLDEAHEAARRGLDYADEKRAEGYIYEILGRIETAPQKWDEAETHFKQAIAIQQEFDEHAYKASATRYYASMMLLKARTLLNTSVAMFDELEIPHELEKSRRLLDRLRDIE